ncbi:DUF6171 family protein [Scatolibacter rhodanostii]|uniref:DUF6171 family protein n=1 Tax=Scatolibacter rhodanostii TaxID=2014781 RepID=UPI000C08C261|nr:DUF6171 family protein [Scatolibacter rhodanostii]
MNTDSPKFCRRCLLKDISSDEYFNTIYEYIENLDASQKVSSNEYEKRLDSCRSCDHLVNGMCELCGCFVEVRAIKRQSHCAQSSEIW